MKLKLTSHKYKQQQQQQLHHYVQHYHYGSSIIFSIIICWTYIQNNNKHATHGTEHRRVTSGSECSKSKKGRARARARRLREGCAVLSPHHKHTEALRCDRLLTKHKIQGILDEEMIIWMFLRDGLLFFRTDLSFNLPTSLKNLELLLSGNLCLVYSSNKTCFWYNSNKIVLNNASKYFDWYINLYSGFSNSCSIIKRNKSTRQIFWKFR